MPKDKTPFEDLRLTAKEAKEVTGRTRDLTRRLVTVPKKEIQREDEKNGHGHRSPA